MKLNKIFKYMAVAVTVGTLAGVTSCNYLDVVPPEQANLEDAMKTHTNALGFLQSCYAGLTAGDPYGNNVVPTDYQSVFCSSTDEYVLPNEQESTYKQIFAALKNTQTTDLSNINHLWGVMYKYIGQCLLFEEQLTTVGREYDVCTNEQEEQQWLAESRFLKAFYHFVLLRTYGPIPLTTELIPMDSPESSYDGRYHFDYCVRYLANEFDLAAKDLPATRDAVEFGRATSVIAKAMKARLLLYAASDLWNGKFPYPEWKNVNFETPGYGKNLVSSTYDRSKWELAYEATKEAIDLAEANSHGLMQTYEPESNVPLSTMDWVPVDFKGDSEKEEFLTKVMLNRYIHATSQSENPEILWSLYRSKPFLESGRLPLKIIKNKNGTWYQYGYSVVNPTLNTVYGFLCKDGHLPAENNHSSIDFPPRNEWFKAMSNPTPGHEDIINLMRNREPRFYAWIAFDGGNFLNRLCDGQPLTLNFKSSAAQGFSPSEQPKNLASTGFLAMKHLNPVTSVSAELNLSSGTTNPTVMCRLTELYLNLAECAAELANQQRPGADDTYKTKAMYYLNIIRQRAGVGLLEDAQIDEQITDPATGKPKTMTLVEWVRQERFIELWDEGHRYFDVRRWVAGPEYFGAGVRQGLTGDVANPETFEEFNTPKNINPTFAFANRQYLYPVFINEVYKNPQMIQAPGF
ncbi:MAG: RagB/SusD family nutrient uptake outer membrane protein [Bacteroides sp.]|nr:RagB/SusD family nutrient uptake outer membrane protein [Bacteroides sp.]MCM1379368.1 RagB/SusD family nutrient uptake outer membrane protein [Bacteroides sp.]MCM1445228.1 RagB/SusD family nutrient uptake outer membrane protein [Prevotella sp.]